MRGNRKDRFEMTLNSFPDSARTLLQHLPQQGGKLSSKTCNELMSLLDISYAPYTGNFAGCAVQTPEGEVVSGSYVESVAYNPSISPLLSVILRLNLMSLKETHAIDRIVLVEKPTLICQMDIVEVLIRSWAPGIELDYHIAEEEE